MWKTMGIINKDNVINKVTRLAAVQSTAVILSRFDHPCTIKLLALKGPLPVTHTVTQKTIPMFYHFGKTDLA
jgi:hypothetical protein